MPQPQHVDDRILKFVANLVLPDQNSPYLARLELEKLLADAWVGQQNGRGFGQACTVRAAAGLFTGARNSYKRAKSKSALLVHFRSINAAPAAPGQCQGSPPRLAMPGDR